MPTGSVCLCSPMRVGNIHGLWFRLCPPIARQHRGRRPPTPHHGPAVEPPPPPSPPPPPPTGQRVRQPVSRSAGLGLGCWAHDLGFVCDAIPRPHHVSSPLWRR